jgi:RNA polymerase sigma-70 factor (ECF subfamily)
MDQRENGRDAAWLQRVFEQFEAPLVGYAARLVGDADRGREIVQDVFLRLCAETSAQAREHTAGWLFKVCRNRAFDVRKKEQRMGSCLSNDADQTVANLPDPAVVAQRKEEASQARQLLAQLPENQREVIRLKVEHDLSYREISQITGLSVSNVGYLLHHGLQSLRKQLAHQRT